MFFEKPPSHISVPPNQNGTMGWHACWVRKMYWRREHAQDKTRVSVLFVVCTAGAFIGLNEWITRGEKMTKVR